MSLLRNTGKLAGCTVFVTGASRGIGKAIALKAAQDGANVVIAAKSAEPHPKLPGTIYTAAKEMEDAGGRCLPCVVDVRDEQQVQAAVDKAVETFGGIDILVNNASAIQLTGTLATPMKRYDLMMGINTRGTYMTSKLCLPHLLKSNNPHILNISPPLNLKPIWFANHCAYTMAKYGMSLCVLGMAEEFKKDGVAVNALWPRTGIATAALEMLAGDAGVKTSRKAEIMADAAYAILSKPSRECTGQFLIDDAVLNKEGITDLSPYSCVPGAKLMPDFFLDEAEEMMKSHTVSSGGGTPSAPPAAADTPSPAAPADKNTPEGIFANIKPLITEDVVKQMKGTFLFELSGANAGSWLLDLKNSPGSVGPADKDTQADVTMKMTSENMVAMFTGKLGATTAFMTGKLKISGNMGLAMKLEQLIGKVRSKL